ncbi:hypothetical protein [Streptomyces sp. NPDC058268]|uniref:hypothetical protein n=1 Tax=Streptomyces sp. NPDC058268 TaxID=3346413 RepID=UPI0036E1E2E0
MRGTATPVLLAALLLGGLTACSSGGDDGGRAKPSSSTAEAASAETESTTESSSPPELSARWRPKLEAANDSSKPGICKHAGAKVCTDHITKLREVVYALDGAIDEAGVAAAYPKTKATIGKVESASEAYVEDGCAGSSEATLGGTACGGHVQWLLLGPATVEMTVTTDELNAAK